jgi:hypothetical protein
MAALAAELGASPKQNGMDFGATSHVNDAPHVAPDDGSAPEQEPPPASSWSFAEETRLRSALAAIPTDENVLAKKFGHSHDTWVKIGRAIERLDWGERGFNIFRDWSAQNAGEFDEKGLRTQWASFARNRNARENPATIATVYYYARKFGWSSQSNNKISDVEEKPSTDVPPLSIDVWLKRDLPAPDYLIGNWLTTTSRVLFASDTGLGKTNFALAAFAHLAAGRSFLHWDIPQPRRVLYVDGEMSRRLLKQRLEDAVRRLGVAPDALHVLSHEDVEGFQPLNTKAGQKYILEVIKSVGAEAVAFDNIMALVVGDMKDEDAWRDTLPLINNLTKQGVGQIWVHHTGHDATRGYGTKTREWRMDTVMHGTAAERPDTDVSFLLEFRTSGLATLSSKW